MLVEYFAMYRRKNKDHTVAVALVWLPDVWTAVVEAVALEAVATVPVLAAVADAPAVAEEELGVASSPHAVAALDTSLP